MKNFKEIMKDFNHLVCVIRLYKNWYTYILNHYKLVFWKKFIVLKMRNNNFKFKTRANTIDASLINETFLNHAYTFVWGDCIFEKSVIVDIGAHIGSFSIYAAKKARYGKVYSFEPAKETFELLVDNIKLNQIKNITPFNSAVCFSSEERILYKDPYNTGASSLYVSNENKKKLTPQNVNCLNFEEFCNSNDLRRIDFLKMDCKGAEYDILLNLSEEILSRIDKIALEYHYSEQYELSDLVKFLEKNNFKVIVFNEPFGILYAKSLNE